MQKSKRRASLTKLGSLLDGALRRHGVTKQVTAAIIVDRANEILDELLGDSVLCRDIRVISYANGVLVIGCDNAGASYDLDGMTPQILARLGEEVPEAEVHTITPRVQIERGRF